MNPKTVVDKLSLLIISATVFAAPLFFLPLTPDFYNWNKQTLILGSGCLLTILWAIRNMLLGRVVIYKGTGGASPAPTFGLSLLGLLVVTLISTFLNPDPVSALMGKTMLFLGLFLFYFAASQAIEALRVENPKPEGLGNAEGGSANKFLIYPFIASAVILSMVSILQYMGLLTKILQGSWISRGWTPTGDQFGQITVAAAAFIYLLASTFRRFLGPEGKTTIRPYIQILLAVLLLPPLVLFASELFSREPKPAFLPLPYSAGWSVSTRVMGENLKATFLGFGPENFSAAFTRFKPAYLNGTNLWNTVFLKSSNVPFHLLTTAGILGLLFWALIVLRVFKRSLEMIRRKRTVDAETAAALGTLLLQLLLPPSLCAWFALIVFLVAAEDRPDQVGATSNKGEVATFTSRLDRGLKSATPNVATSTDPAVILSALIIFSLAATYLTVRAYRGERDFYKSFRAIEENRAIDAYNLQAEAIRQNPKNFKYHQTFSQTNRLLANSLLRNLGRMMEEESDEERQRRQNQATALIQRSIDEAKAAISIAPNRFENWQNLAEIYRSLIGLLDGAQSWAIASYQNAINLNPLDPGLRVNLGGIFYGLGEWDEAIYTFRLATQAKPDYANAWYNLSAAYKASGDNQKAAIALKNVVGILPENDPDKMKAQNELDGLVKSLPEEQKETLKEATPSSKLEPQRPETPPEREASPSSKSPFSPFVE